MRSFTYVNDLAFLVAKGRQMNDTKEIVKRAFTSYVKVFDGIMAVYAARSGDHDKYVETARAWQKHLDGWSVAREALPALEERHRSTLAAAHTHYKNNA